jgi:DNA-binding response OmpR family regulator
MFHILIVDDDKNTRKLMRTVLEAERYTVSTAENGEDALAIMDKEHIDLVILDIMMPVMDGYDFTKALRHADNNLPILMVSAKQLPADRKQGFIVGTDDYMTSLLMKKNYCCTSRHCFGAPKLQ